MANEVRGTATGQARPVAKETQILALMLRIGADIPQISKLTGIPLETVRYVYRAHFLKRRLRVQRELQHEKLGLSHIQFIVTADPGLEPLFFNSALLSGVWEELYINTVYRITPENQFFLDHLEPPAFHSKLREFYGALEDLGVIRVRGTYECARLRHPRMWVEDYNWELPGWDFDWSPTSLKPPRNIEDPPPSARAKFDKTDLKIIGRLQSRYDQKITDVAAKESIDKYSASWHFRKHVEGRGLFGEYRINWLGTFREAGEGSAPQTRQSFVGLNFIADDLSPLEMMNARAHLHSIPYLYSEKVGDSDYHAETFIPLHSLMEAFGFFSKVLRPLGDRARLFTVDQTGAATYAVHPGLFDEESKRWVYRGDLVLEGIKGALARGLLGHGRKPAANDARGSGPD